MCFLVRLLFCFVKKFKKKENCGKTSSRPIRKNVDDDDERRRKNKIKQKRIEKPQHVGKKGNFKKKNFLQKLEMDGWKSNRDRVDPETDPFLF